MSRRSTKARRAATRRRKDYALVANETPLPTDVRLNWNPVLRCWNRVYEMRWPSNVQPKPVHVSVRVLTEAECKWLMVGPGGRIINSNIEWIS